MAIVYVVDRWQLYRIDHSRLDNVSFLHLALTSGHVIVTIYKSPQKASCLRRKGLRCSVIKAPHGSGNYWGELARRGSSRVLPFIL